MQKDTNTTAETNKKSGVYFGYLKTFLRSTELVNIHISTFVNILIVQNSKPQCESLFSCSWPV